MRPDPAELEAALDAAGTLAAMDGGDAAAVHELVWELSRVEPGFIRHVSGVLVQRGQVDQPRLTLAQLYDPHRPVNPGGGPERWRLITGQGAGYLAPRVYSAFRDAGATARAILRERLRRTWAHEAWLRERGWAA